MMDLKQALEMAAEIRHMMYNTHGEYTLLDTIKRQQQLIDFLLDAMARPMWIHNVSEPKLTEVDFTVTCSGYPDWLETLKGIFDRPQKDDLLADWKEPKRFGTYHPSDE